MKIRRLERQGGYWQEASVLYYKELSTDSLGIVIWLLASPSESKVSCYPAMKISLHLFHNILSPHRLTLSKMRGDLPKVVSTRREGWLVPSWSGCDGVL